MKKLILLLFLIGTAASGKAITLEKFIQKYKDCGIYTLSDVPAEVSGHPDSTYIESKLVLLSDNFNDPKEAARFRKDVKRLSLKNYTRQLRKKDEDLQMHVYTKGEKDSAYWSEIITCIELDDSVIFVRMTGRIKANLKNGIHTR